MERKFTIFTLFYFVFKGKFQVQALRGAYIRRGDLTEGFLRYDFGGLTFGGAYFRNFTVFDMYTFNALYLLHSYNPSFLICMCFNMDSLRGQKKLGPRPDRSPLGL